jgi:mRNA interferase YafQ
MRSISRSSAFRKDYKRLQKRGFEIRRLKRVIEALARGQKMEDRYRDHPLRGNYEGWRECHIAPDWLLIYILTDEELSLARTGTHADLFE